MTSRRHDLTNVDRRGVLKLGAAAALATVPLPAVAHGLPPAVDRRLSFYNLHTGERLDALYWSRGDYVGRELRRVNHILRDFRTGEVMPIDLRLLDTLYELRRRMDSREPFHVISGYRSPRTNAMLVSQSNGGVAKKSYHMRGMAIDVRLPERDLARLRRTAMAMKRGGVGYYPSSGFIHVDVGPVRYW